MEKSDLKEQKLNQRIVQLIQEGETKYRCDHWMNAVLQWICLIILTVSMIGLVYDVAWKYPRYRSNEQQSVRQLQQYREERKRILNGEIVVDTADFTQILKDKASTLKIFRKKKRFTKSKLGHLIMELISIRIIFLYLIMRMYWSSKQKMRYIN